MSRRFVVGLALAVMATLFVAGMISFAVNSESNSLPGAPATSTTSVVSVYASAEDEYLAEVHRAVPVTLSVSDLIVLEYGQAACDARAVGATKSELLDMAMDNGVPYSDADVMLDLAFRILC